MENNKMEKGGVGCSQTEKKDQSRGHRCSLSQRQTMHVCKCVLHIFKDIWQLTESPLTTEVIKELLNIKSKLWVSSGALPHRAAVQINYTL